MAKSASKHLIKGKNQLHVWEKIVAVLFGVAFLITILVIALKFPNPSNFQYIVFRIILALASAGVAAIIPGFVEFQTKMAGAIMRAGGAIAIFMIIYFYSPAKLIVTPRVVNLSGRIMDRLNNPIVNAMITVDAYHFKAKSKSDGNFIEVLNGAKVGDVITVRVFHQDYKSYSFDKTINSSVESCGTITLSK